MYSKLFLALFVFGLPSCQLFDKEEEIPSFIYIDKVSVETNGTGKEGSITSKITDAWVFINDNNMGSWELPAKIPLYAGGSQNLKIIGGIRTNGLDAFQDQYPFWDFYQKKITLIRGDSLIINPILQYYSSTNFTWKEDFESAGISIDSVLGSQTTIQLISDKNSVLEKSVSGAVILQDSITFYKGITNEIFTLPTASAPIYLELDYKTNIDFVIFLVAHNPSRTIETSVIGVKAKLDDKGSPIQNKIYVDLSFDVSNNYTASGYQIGFSAKLPNTIAQGKLILDNIKLIRQ